MPVLRSKEHRRESQLRLDLFHFHCTYVYKLQRWCAPGCGLGVGGLVHLATVLLLVHLLLGHLLLLLLLLLLRESLRLCQCGGLVLTACKVRVAQGRDAV